MFETATVNNNKLTKNYTLLVTQKSLLEFKKSGGK